MFKGHEAIPLDVASYRIQDHFYWGAVIEFIVIVAIVFKMAKKQSTYIQTMQVSFGSWEWPDHLCGYCGIILTKISHKQLLTMKKECDV